MPDAYSVMEGGAASASHQEWFIDAFLRRGEDIYARCGRMVEEAGGLARHAAVLSLPCTAPMSAPTQRVFFGLNGTHDKRHMLRAVYEGVVFCRKLHIQRLLRHTAMPACVNIAGGAA